jgi:hypothetical protein
MCGTVLHCIHLLWHQANLQINVAKINFIGPLHGYLMSRLWAGSLSRFWAGSLHIHDSDLRTNNSFFCKQYSDVGFVMKMKCFLWGWNWTFKYVWMNFRLQKVNSKIHSPPLN